MSKVEFRVQLPSSWDSKKKAEQNVLVSKLGKTVGVAEGDSGTATLTIHGVSEITDDMRKKVTEAGFTILSE